MRATIGQAEKAAVAAQAFHMGRGVSRVPGRARAVRRGGRKGQHAARHCAGQPGQAGATYVATDAAAAGTRGGF